MAALTEATPIRHRGTPSQLSLLIANSSVTYPGGLIATNAAGLAIPYASATGVRVAGICVDAEAKTGDGSTVECSVKVDGTLVEQVTVTGVTGQADVNSEVYGVTDNLNDLTLTAGLKGAVGMITRYHSGTTCDVWIYPASSISADS